MNNHYDVIVVGAGPAGIFTCYELTLKLPGANVLLIDKGHDIYISCNKDFPIARFCFPSYKSVW
ncbi:hypothetical protein B1694_08540 [Geobacillus zalihae]|nr:NAD(P)-binding protein [Geobacillus zalihae]OQP23583.1 hypothetical protein B1694_08540 [Geobacillus zalihae]